MKKTFDVINNIFSIKIDCIDINHEWVDIEKMTKHLNKSINNPIQLAKYVNHWVHSVECNNEIYREEYNKRYLNTCKRLLKFVKDPNIIDVRYGFNEDNWTMTIEVFKKII